MSEDLGGYTVGADTGPYPRVMTVEEVAAYLQISLRSVYNLAAAGEIPAVKIAGQWRFYRPELERWLSRLSRAHVGEPFEGEESNEV